MTGLLLLLLAASPQAKPRIVVTPVEPSAADAGAPSFRITPTEPETPAAPAPETPAPSSPPEEIWDGGTVGSEPPSAPTPATPEHGFLLTLIEHDSNGKQSPLLENDGIVDINSDVEIDINTEQVKRQLPREAIGPLTERLVADQAMLASSLMRMAQSLAPLRDALDQYWKSPTEETRAQLEERLQGELSAGRLLLPFASEPQGTPSPVRASLRRGIEQLLDNPGMPPVEQYRVLHEATANAIAQVKHSLDQAVHEEGTYFMLGAALVTPDASHPVKLVGFAPYEEAPRFDPDRWKLAFTDVQRAQLAQLTQRLAEATQAGGSGTPLQLIDAIGALSADATPVSADAALLRADPTIPSDARAQLDTIGRDAASLRDFADSLRQKYGAQGTPPPSGESALLAIKADLDELTRRSGALAKEIDALPPALHGQPGQALHAAAIALANATSTLPTKLVDALAPAEAVRQAIVDAQALGDTLRHAQLAELPSRTRLSLVTAGRRAPGDAIAIKLAVGRGEAAPQELEVRRVRMFRILLNLQSAVGVIFATHPSIQGVSSSTFEVAPAYSLTLHFGDRDLPLLDGLITPAFGINVSALDFDRDGTPELGLGGVVTLFHDVVQVGGGYNVFKNDGYFFFGLGIPLSGFSGATGGVSGTP
jgi:hypothetical protein